MNYELAKQLKHAGFPQEVKKGIIWHKESGASQLSYDIEDIYIPTLEELIDACGEPFWWLSKYIVPDTDGSEERWKIKWIAYCFKKVGNEIPYDTAIEAVAHLWLALNKK